jgi:hypothetical protein
MSQDPDLPIRIFAVESEPPNEALDDEPVEQDWLAGPPTVDSLDESFQEFVKEDVQPSALASLSDLDRTRLAYLREHWLTLPEEVRMAIVSKSTDLGESNVEMHFGRLLRFALEDPSPAVRQFAVLGLMGYDDADSADVLLDHFQHDGSEDVRAEAASALSQWAELYDPTSPADIMQFRRIWNTLIKFAQSAAEPLHVRARAMESASVFEVDQRVQALINEFYAEDETGLRLSAIVAMGNSGDRQWIPILSSELDSDDNELRRAAANALGQIADPVIIPDLRKATKDNDIEVRHAAIWALGNISGPAAQRILSELAANPLPDDAQVIQMARSLDEDIDSLDEEEPDSTPFF